MADIQPEPWSRETSDRMLPHIHDVLVAQAPRDFDALLQSICGLIDSSHHGNKDGGHLFHAGAAAAAILILNQLRAWALGGGR